jgi:hypothetical protein
MMRSQTSARSYCAIATKILNNNGQAYEITGGENTLTVKKHSGDRTDVILQAHEGGLACTTVTPQDMEIFAVFVEHLQAVHG